MSAILWFMILVFAYCPSPGSAADAEENQQERWKPPRVYWKDGLQFDLMDQKLKMKAGGELQVDGGLFALDEALQEQFGDETSDARFRRARIYVVGSVRKRFHFKSEWDFTGSDGATIKNNYLEIRELPLVQNIRIGYMQEPFSLNQVTNNASTLFMERSLANTLAPRHNTGIMFYASPVSKSFTLTAGWFYDTDNFGQPKGDAQALTVRWSVVPVYRDEGSRLFHIGFNYSFRNQTEDTARFRQQPESYLLPNFVDTKTFQADSLSVYGLEGVFVNGPWTLEGEAILSNAHNSQPGVDKPFFYGYYIETAYAPGGGRQRYYDRDRGIFERILPDKWPDPGKFDADRWVITSRFSRIDLDSKSIHGGVLTDLTLGLNWVVSRYTLIQWNYVLSHLQDAGTANIFEMRFQIFL